MSARQDINLEVKSGIYFTVLNFKKKSLTYTKDSLFERHFRTYTEDQKFYDTKHCRFFENKISRVVNGKHKRRKMIK